MPAYCMFCGAELMPHDASSDDCKACHQAHRDAIEAGEIPAGLPREAYEFWLWKRIRQLERDVVAGRTSESEAKAEVVRLVENAKKDYERLQFIKAAEEQRRLKRRGEFSGPTGFLI